MSELPPNPSSNDPQQIRDLLLEALDQVGQDLQPPEAPGMSQLRAELFAIKNDPNHTEAELNQARQAIWQRHQQWLAEQQLPPDDPQE